MTLEFKDIYKSFGEKKVLEGISFKVSSGSALGLLGRNGAGKTTSIRILMDVFPSDSGEILLDGKPLDVNKVKIGYLPEERGLYPKKKISDQLIYFARLKGLGKRDALQAVDRWLDRLKMTEYKNKRLDTLSKGNQQKIQLVCALIHEPDIVILDEPFSGLDPVNAMLLKDVIKEQIDNGKIVIFSSHQMNYIEEFCDSIAILYGGKIAVSGELREIKRSYPRDRLVVKSTEAERIAKELDCCTLCDSVSAEIKLSSPSDKRSIMAELSEKYDIDEIKVYEPTLNDIFVQYTDRDGETEADAK